MPNEELQDLLKDIPVQCINCKNGCQWTGPLAHYEQHMPSCDFVEIECIHGCGNRFPRNLLDQHEDTCSLRTYNCEYCHEYTSVGLMDMTSIHWAECKCFPVPCPQNCGQQSIERQNLNHHIENECLLTVVSCGVAGCDVQLPRKDMTAHLEDHKDQPEHYLLDQREQCYTCKYCHEYISVASHPVACGQCTS